MAYEQNLSRGLQSAVDNTPIEDGKLRFAVDTARLYLDLANERIEFTDFIPGLTRQEIVNLEAPLPKMYLSSDTHELLYYHAEEWISFSGDGGADGLGQLIHKTYLKGLKTSEDDKLIGILGDGSEVDTGITLVQSVTELVEKVNTLEECLLDLTEDHYALVEAVTEWGEFGEDIINRAREIREGE